MIKQEHYDIDYFVRLLEAYLQKDPAIWKRINIIFQHLKPSAEDIILETGCGQGTIAYELSKACRLVYAVDDSELAMQAARKFLQERNDITSKRVVLVKADLRQLPFPSETFRKINYSEVIEHLNEPLEVLLELRRCMVPGGFLFLTTWPNSAHLVYRWTENSP